MALVAERTGLEILSVDSRQLYRRLELGTAKPTAAERARVKHHLLDALDPAEICSARRFRDLALVALKEAGNRSVGLLGVGGAGPYWEALVRGLHDLPSASAEIRARHVQLLAEEGPDALHRRLRAVDPPTADRLAPGDTQRVSRALDVHELTGLPLTALHREARPEARSIPVVALLRPKEGSSPPDALRRTPRPRIGLWPTYGGECEVASRSLAVPPLGVDRHRRESPVRRGKIVAVSPESRTFPRRGDTAARPGQTSPLRPDRPYVRGENPGWSCSSEPSAVLPGGRANGSTICRALEGGLRLTEAAPLPGLEPKPELVPRAKKMKVIRLEAVRAGFKYCWQNRDYRTIMAVAQRIPEAVLEEDPKLLMWYDQAVTRSGEQ